MRPTLSILLLLLLVLPFAGMYSWLLMEKKQVRQEVKKRLLAGIEEEDLTLLVFSCREAAQQLDWEHAGEFEYQGQKYDVVQRSEKNDTLYFWCWWDREETELDHQLEAWLTRNLDNDPLDQQRRLQFQYFFKNLYNSTFSKNSNIDLSEPNACPHPSHLLRFTEGLRSPPVPPPKVFSIYTRIKVV